MNILALDPATKTGWATMMASGTWDFKIMRDESAGMRLIRLRSKLFETCIRYAGDTGSLKPYCDIDLIVFEAARNAGPKMQGALVVQAELQSVIKVFCEQHLIQYRGFSPAEIKRHACQKGNASKEMVYKAALVKWGPYVEDDNQADALWLLDLAQTRYCPEVLIDK